MRIEYIRPNIKSQGWDVRWPDDYEGGYIKALVQRNEFEEVYDIGTGNGFAAICMAMGGAEVYTFDVRNRSKIWEHGKFGDPEVGSRIHFRQLGSPECFQKINPQHKDALFFLDGDYGYQPSWDAFNGALSVVHPGDLIVVMGVKSEKKVERFWKEVVAKNPNNTETIRTKNGLGIYRVVP